MPCNNLVPQSTSGVGLTGCAKQAVHKRHIIRLPPLNHTSRLNTRLLARTLPCWWIGASTDVVGAVGVSDGKKAMRLHLGLFSLQASCTAALWRGSRLRRWAASTSAPSACWSSRASTCCSGWTTPTSPCAKPPRCAPLASSTGTSRRPSAPYDTWYGAHAHAASLDAVQAAGLAMMCLFNGAAAMPCRCVFHTATAWT